MQPTHPLTLIQVVHLQQLPRVYMSPHLLRRRGGMAIASDCTYSKCMSPHLAVTASRRWRSRELLRHARSCGLPPLSLRAALSADASNGARSRPRLRWDSANRSSEVFICFLHHPSDQTAKCDATALDAEAFESSLQSLSLASRLGSSRGSSSGGGRGSSLLGSGLSVGLLIHVLATRGAGRGVLLLQP